MARTDNLRRQHDAAVALVGEMQGAIEAWTGTELEGRRIGLTLARLAGLLRIHFAQEDRLLYPVLQTCDDPVAAAVARQFAAEMGGLGAAFGAFVERWSSGPTIVTDFDLFRTESQAIFAALADRIERENGVLYPLADAQGSDLARPAA